MNKIFGFVCSALLLGLLSLDHIEGKKSQNAGGATCPGTGIGCIECSCEGSTGFNDCKPTTCPDPIKSLKAIPKTKQEGYCPFGLKFKAECSICYCSGQQDLCSICSALPMRQMNQPEEVNDALPWLKDNRMYNYEVNGWAPYDEEEEDGEGPEGE